MLLRVRGQNIGTRKPWPPDSIKYSDSSCGLITAARIASTRQFAVCMCFSTCASDTVSFESWMPFHSCPIKYERNSCCWWHLSVYGVNMSSEHFLPRGSTQVLLSCFFECRAVGWHLHSCKERTELDATQWRSHSEALEANAATEKASYVASQVAIDAQVRGVADLSYSRLCGYRLWRQSCSKPDTWSRLRDTEAV